MNWITNFLCEEDATTAVEYAVMLALVLLAVVGAIGSVGAETGGMWGGIDSDMATAGLGK